MNHFRLCATVVLAAAATSFAQPTYLEDQFEIPPGFRVYKAAARDLTGGSYDITFDGQGRLLVGDGEAVRRLSDDDGDGVYDRFEVIAKGLGDRGPQGLLVYGDRLYAVGGDGVQLFEGYESGGELKHVGRLGARFNTGGDHAAHTVLRGHDGHVYFVSGDGGGINERLHITEATSPVLVERAASVFRFSPDGSRWECVSAGGRNPPNVGMNYLGELFSWDSDMEWHVDLPWYRPLRLNHWVQGGDQGWQGVGAYPPYYVDALPPVMDAGRGSPTWGVFYEHDQFPEQYRDAFLVCDYRWKSATSGSYNTVGRLVSFSLSRDGAGWKAGMEVVLRPKPGALDADGKPINFALVDVDVAPDGSLFISDHNQGIWRVVYDPGKGTGGSALRIVPEPSPLPAEDSALVEFALATPQKGSEWARLRVERVRARMGKGFEAGMKRVALSSDWSLARRLQAVRLLAPGFAGLETGFLAALAGAEEPELRGQAAWLLGLRVQGESDPLLGRLLEDTDPFVRRRAGEALARSSDAGAVAGLLSRLADPERMVQYVAMNALAHRPADAWLDGGLQKEDSPSLVRVLVAARLGRHELPQAALERAVGTLLGQTGLTRTEELDVLRVLGLFREELAGGSPSLERAVETFLISRFPSEDRDVRWEQARLIGDYGVTEGFVPLLEALEGERDPVTQFHLAQAIARLNSGWTRDQAVRLKRWFMTTQDGWFARMEGKGRQFPEFWGTVLAEYAGRHVGLLSEDLDGIDLGGALGDAVLDRMSGAPGAGPGLMAVFGTVTDESIRRRLIEAMGNVRQPATAAFLRKEFASTTDERTRSAILLSLAKMPRDQANQAVLVQGLGHSDAATVMNCGRALIPYRPELDRTMADQFMRQLARETELTPRLSSVLMMLSKVSPRPRFSEGTPRGEIVDYWGKWYENRFNAAFKPEGAPVEMKSNEQLYDFLNSDRIAGGDAARGGAVFVNTQCAACHGGPGFTDVLFGPDLAGVTRRLQRRELAEAIVYPSKLVAERFRATEVELKDGEALTGFITEQNPEALTVAVQGRVHRVARAEVESISPRELSLMPEGLLAGLSWEQVKDLFAYLDSLGTEKP